MVVDFLEQLSAALPSTEEEFKDVLRGKLKNSRKLELRLIDRKKISNDGYAIPQYLRLLSHKGRAFGTRTQSFPKGVRASIIPFGRTGSNALQPDLTLQHNSSASLIWLMRR